VNSFLHLHLDFGKEMEDSLNVSHGANESGPIFGAVVRASDL